MNNYTAADYSKLVSIIMPVFNAENYLVRSIGSVIAQSYKNWELLIVDDGSTDQSRSIIQSFCINDDRIKLFCNSHGGTAHARNTALDRARGDYIAFIDADDAYHPEYLQSLVHACTVKDVDIAICRIIEGNDEQAFLSEKKEPNFTVNSSSAVLTRMYSGEWADFITSCTKVYKAELFKNLRFPDGMFFEDLATIHKAIYYANKIAITDSALYFYNKTPDSSSKTRKSVELLDREKALRSHWEFYLSFNREDLALKAISFYLIELITIYYRVEQSDKPEDALLIKKQFNKIYHSYKKRICLSIEQREKIFAFQNPNIYDIRNMIRDKGVFRTIIGFLKRKIELVKR